MHNASSRRALVLLMSLLILAGMLHAQIIIKDTIQIKPNHLPLMATAAVTQPIHFELSWNGGLNGWVDVYLYEPCGGGDDYKGRWETNSQSLSFSAVGPQAGKYTVNAIFFGAQTGISNLTLTVFDEGLPTKEIPFPIGSTFVEYNTPYYSGFRFYDNSNGRDEDIVYEDFTGMSLVNEYNCNGTRWMPSGNPLVTYTITQGSEYASLAEYFSRTIYGNAYTASYQDGAPIVVANGIRPAGNDGALVEVTAQSGDVIATRRFRVRPYYYRIVPESLTIKTGEETIIALSLVNWYGGEHNRGVAAATELILEDTADVGTLRFEKEDGEILQTSDTLANIDVPVSPYFRGSVKFIGNAIALTDTLSVKIKARKSGEGNWIWIQRPRQAPYEGATATTGEGELRIIPGEAQFDHFEVKVERDTVAFTESAKIFVQAKDASDQNVELAADKLVTLSVTTNTDYGTFIDQNNDTLKTTPVKLEHIPYGDAKAGLIQFAAVKKNPADPLLCKVKVELESDPTKTGEGEVPVVEQTLKIVMEGERKVEPRNLLGRSTPAAPTNANKKEFKVQLTRNKAAVVGHSFQLTNDYIDGTGGHDHLTLRRTRNRDNYGWFILKRTNGVSDSPYDGQTQDDGRETFDYVSSFFGDRIRLRVETTQPNKKQFLWDTLSLVEKVDGLVLFSGAGSYSLKGEKPAHPNNHYLCSRAAVDSLINAANAFAKAKWNTTGTMRLNDMSLELGGLFDVDSNWNRPHSLHRAGKSVDIENIQLERVDTVSISTGKDTTFTVPKVTFIRDFQDFMESKMKNWQFKDEGQTRQDVFKRTRKYPHFEWKGK